MTQNTPRKNKAKINWKRAEFCSLLSSAVYFHGEALERKLKEHRPTQYGILEFDKDGAEGCAFRYDRETVYLAFRGTEPTEWNDIAADLKAIPVMAETVSRVHKGFKEEVDELWPMVLEDLQRKTNESKTIWFCGHSLGAAMATIMASRCHLYPSIKPVEELYTYGSPKVGWPGYVKSLAVEHHRWRNNNDIVTKVPLWLMGYRHHGTLHYITSDSKIGKPGFIDWCKGMWDGIKNKKFDSIRDHDIQAYHDQIEKAL